MQASAVPATLRALSLAALLMVASAAAQAPIGLRVALVIGNAAYPTLPLANPGNDAKAMSETLKGIGFEVVEARDASKAQMQQAIAQAGAALKGKNGVGVLYYAGHGLQLDWRNYMVPVDAKLAAAADVPSQTVDIQTVIDMFRDSGTRMNILMLDACRDNPFAASASGKGLAQMDAPPGTLLAFATAPGNVAEDGSAASGNGLYTQFLIQEIKQPEARIEDVFKRVRLQVRRRSEGRQIPWESTSLEDDFYFDPHAQRGSDEAREKAFAVEKAGWDRIKESTDARDFYAYLQKYPSGLISEQAQFRLDQLQKAKIQAQPGADGVQVLASGEDRYAVGDVIVRDEIDGFTGQRKRVLLRATSADHERVAFNDGEVVFDQMGGVLRNRFGTKDPAIVGPPADIAIGKRWRSAFTNTRKDGASTTNFWEFKVTALEEVVVPAGTFKAFRIERRGQAQPDTGAITFMTGTEWVDPKTMHVVRSVRLFRRNGAIIENGTDELVSFEHAPRSPAGR